MTQQMSDTKTIKEAKVEPANGENLPVVISHSGDLESEYDTQYNEFVQMYPDIATLTAIQQRILFALTENIVSDDTKTDGEIAAELGIHRKTIQHTRRSSKFARIWGALTVDLVRGIADKPINNLIRLGKTNVHANEILLRVPGVYTPAQKLMSLHADVTRQAQSASREQNIEDTLIEWGAKGLSIQWIAEKWAKLKAEGAF